MTKIAILRNPIQGYSWGSRTFIPQLMGDPSPATQPQAELWMGAHPKAPSQVLCDGQWISLPELIQENPEGILGKRIAKRFSNELPFLFKILAAAKPLSIQAHPNRKQAREGFARENRLRIPLNASNRNYRDENHKPELICALGPFWALRGFRNIEDILSQMDGVDIPGIKAALIALEKQSDREGLRGLFTTLMMSDEVQKQRILTKVLTGIRKDPGVDPLFGWVIKLNQEFPGDIGVLSPLFLNLVRLQPGEAMHIPAGELHAYLEGIGVELMANSDNVLRGGLTTKHMDAYELLRILTFTHGEVSILHPKMERNGEMTYPSDAEEFMLSVISVQKDAAFESSRTRSVEILICMEGDVVVTNLGSGDVLSLSKGTAILVPAGVEQYRVDGQATLYKASVPL